MADKRNLLDKVESLSLIALLGSAAGASIGILGSFVYWLICG